MVDTSKCCTCGYEWKTGTSGGHSCTYTIQSNIKQLKEHHKTELDMYDQNITAHVLHYGSAPCDYLAHRQRMSMYHRGAYDALKVLDGS